MSKTKNGIPISDGILWNYFNRLIDRFFKILPIRESGEQTLTVYMQSLQSEILGCKALITELEEDAGFLSLAAILQNLIDHPEYTVKTVKREVFRAISICNYLKAKLDQETML